MEMQSTNTMFGSGESIKVMDGNKPLSGIVNKELISNSNFATAINTALQSGGIVGRNVTSSLTEGIDKKVQIGPDISAGKMLTSGPGLDTSKEKLGDALGQVGAGAKNEMGR